VYSVKGLRVVVCASHATYCITFERVNNYCETEHFDTACMLNFYCYWW